MTRQPKNSFILRARVLLFLFLAFSFLIFSETSFAQRDGYLQIFGNIKKDTKNLEGAEIKVMKKKKNIIVQTLHTAENGKFVFNLPFDGEYIISVGKPGLLTKSISVSTTVPKKQKEFIFSFKFNVDLIPAMGDSSKATVNKPIAKIAYSATYEDFEFDPLK